MAYMCAECKHLGCKKGDLTKTMACCPSKNEEILAEAARLCQKPENYNIAHTAASPSILSGFVNSLRSTFIMPVYAQMYGAQYGMGFYVKKFSDFGMYTRSGSASSSWSS